MTDEYLTGQIAQDLDFYRIREQLCQLCVSEEGKELLQNRNSISDKNQINQWKTLSKQWCDLLDSQYEHNLRGFPQVKPIFVQLGVEGSQLFQDQIYALLLFCFSYEKACKIINQCKNDLSVKDLEKLIINLPLLTVPQNEILSIIDENGQLKDLIQLREIKKRIAALHKEVESSIKKYTSDSSLSSTLQSNVPAYRQDRELLAVKADHRGNINGIVHEVSASGSTLFIEPEEVIRANNELLQEEAHLIAETKKIFKELTQKLSLYKEDFEKCFEAMMILDTTYACAKFKKQINGIFADDCLEDENIKLVQARHPLLGEKAIPIDINFYPGKKVLIITGPNTGGKTVTLKTIALFALLNQAGFPVPAKDGTRLPIFTSIFADIGDEQSIDNNLSTFSSHMKRIAQMTELSSDSSLLLLDEFGSGTDPLEGSAIAMAVLDKLIQNNSYVIVTTHHGILKNYGYTNPHCINASVEFDENTLKPTYKIHMGIPGESHAIEIAEKSGLPVEIVEKAKGYISNQSADVSTLIKGLTAKHAELDELLQHQKEVEKTLTAKEFKLKSRELNLNERDIQLKELEKSKSSQFIKETRSKLENLVRELREGEITREKTLAVKSFINEIQDEFQKNNEALENQIENFDKEKEALKEEEEKLLANGIRIKGKEHKGKSSKKTKGHTSNSKALENAKPIEIIRSDDVTVLQEGDEVLVGKEKRQGILVSKEKNGTWTVQFGSIKMKVSENLITLKNKKTSAKATYVIENTTHTTAEKPVFELRLLGMRMEEAIKALEKQLDLCAINNYRNFSVIHGKGNGILQQAVHDYLSHYPGVEDFHFAEPENGGSGKTEVTLK